MEGPIALRRNFNHRFLTLEPNWRNQQRHTCTSALIMGLASDVLPSDTDTWKIEHLQESQTTGSQPQQDELTLTDGSNMLLTEMNTNEVRA